MGLLFSLFGSFVVGSFGRFVFIAFRVFDFIAVGFIIFRVRAFCQWF